MFNELLKNVMNLGIITDDDVKRLTSIELMLLIIERCNGLLDFLKKTIDETNASLKHLDLKYKEITDDIIDTFDDSVLAVLNEWLSDGTLEFLINQTTLGSISNRVNELENQVNPFAVSINISTPVAELGSSQTVTLRWSYNRDIKSQKINDESLEIGVTSMTYSDVTSSTIYTVEAISKLDLKTSNKASITFANGIYYGVSTSTDYNSALILSLSKELTNNKSKTIDVDAGTNQYIYYCIPERLGECSFTVNGFDGGFVNVATVSFTNGYNYTENYRIYKSSQDNLGRTTVIIK